MTLWILTLITRSFAHMLKLGGYGGTTLPGVLVERYAPWLIARYAERYEKVILVTGTNGKTTILHALEHVLSTAGLHVVSNISGSNMMRGIATALLVAGVPKQRSVLICEVEEATMPILSRYLHADIIVVTNLYRDQLDAYGELDKTKEYIHKACLNNPDARLVLNADDPMIVAMGEELLHTKTLYSLGTLSHGFHYEGYASGKAHVDLLVESIALQGDLSTQSVVREGADRVLINFGPPGLYNVYNALATYAVSRLLSVDVPLIQKALSEVKSPFGRGEKVVLTHSNASFEMQILLVKNPAGYAQVWELICGLTEPCDLVLGLNDKIADGRDVSWIWDIDLTQSPRQDIIQHIYFTGTRAYDMALRMKYAQIAGTTQDIVSDIDACMQRLVQVHSSGRKVFALMTYTAMNGLRESLGRYTSLTPYTT